MGRMEGKYRAAVSSDWSECLSPNGPFDPITFTYPQLKPDLDTIFREYTGNEITLTEAVKRISAMLPAALTLEQMDGYLDAEFRTYTGVPDLIEWCLSRDILFVINTTGTQGYFQRAIAKGLLPEVPLVCGNPMIRFPGASENPRFANEVREIPDKAVCTQAILRSLDLPGDRLVVMGDSGGDGPHFEWAAKEGAFLVASMCKDSLAGYCLSKGIAISAYFGLKYGPGEKRDPDREMKVDFMDLTELIERALKLQGERGPR
jgi:phosphoglycolate phosphatase-like HAD superfamily hydrolase